MTQTPAPTASVKIPIVDYLVLEPEPHLRAHECASCKARYFDRRNACANCSGTKFADVDVDTAGMLTTYTIVSYAPPGVDAPFVAAIVDCGGTSVRVTISAGIATRRSGMRECPDMLKDADAALYAAKDSGRNAVRTAAGESPAHAVIAAA